MSFMHGCYTQVSLILFHRVRAHHLVSVFHMVSHSRWDNRSISSDWQLDNISVLRKRTHDTLFHQRSISASSMPRSVSQIRGKLFPGAGVMWPDPGCPCSGKMPLVDTAQCWGSSGERVFFGAWWQVLRSESWVQLSSLSGRPSTAQYAPGESVIWWEAAPTQTPVTGESLLDLLLAEGALWYLRDKTTKSYEM